MARGTTEAVWDAALDRSCAALVREICDCSAPHEARDTAWKRLLVTLAAHVEAWASRSRALRGAGLSTEDDVRAVLVGVFARLGRDDFANLRRWQAQGRAGLDAALDAGDEREETEAIERLVHLARGEINEREVATEGAPRASAATPFRGWLLNLVRFVVKDHVKQRLGWRVLEDESGDKRDLSTNADRLDDVTEAGARPPLTDWLALRRLLDEIRGFAETFPEAMRAALDLWLDDESFDAIAAQLGLENADAARALTRAAHARLRERFRDTWPVVRRAGEA